MAGLDPAVLVLLAVIGLIGGVGITAIGPGGVLATIGLFTLTGLSSAEVAGTAIVTHIATGVLGTAVYVRSGQLRERRTRRDALILAGAAVVGTPLGVLINTAVTERVFGLLLAVLVVVVAGLVWYRERRNDTWCPPSGSRQLAGGHPSTLTVATVGAAVAAGSGIVGVGGPMLTVPLLVTLGVPVLSALAAAQAQSVVIATVGTLGYLAGDSINWPLAAFVGIPELVGVLIGWAIAHAVPTRTLKYALVVALVATAPYLALHG